MAGAVFRLTMVKYELAFNSISCKKNFLDKCMSRIANKVKYGAREMKMT